MAADCSYAPEPGVGTDAEAIIDALEAREGLEVSGRGTAPVGDLTGISLDYTRAAESPGSLPGLRRLRAADRLVR